MITTLYDILDNLIKAVIPTAKVYYMEVPENTTIPYYLIRIISSNGSEPHKDDYTNTLLKYRQHSYTRSRVEVLFAHTKHPEVYRPNIMGNITENKQDIEQDGYKHDIEVINDTVTKEEYKSVGYFVRRIELYVHSYKL